MEKHNHCAFVSRLLNFLDSAHFLTWAQYVVLHIAASTGKHRKTIAARQPVACKVGEAGPCADRLPHNTVSESTQFYFAGNLQKKAQMKLHLEPLLHFSSLSHNPVSRINGVLLKPDAKDKELTRVLILGYFSFPAVRL